MHLHGARGNMISSVAFGVFCCFFSRFSRRNRLSTIGRQIEGKNEKMKANAQPIKTAYMPL